jgi:CheY-like chemotaxis protein
VILVVTADFLKGELIREGLQDYGMQLCRDAFDALDYLEQASIIFLDMQLPAANGVAFMHELASDRSLAGVPIILLAEEPPQIDFELYNIDTVLGVRDLLPKKLCDIVARVGGVRNARC